MRGSRLHGRGRLALGLALAGSVAVGMAPVTSASPAALGIRVDVDLFSRCLDLDDVTGSQAVTVTQKRGGSVIASDTVPADEGSVCLERVLGGDKLTIKQGSNQRTVTVPTLSLQLDLDADRVKGQMPATGPYQFVQVIDLLAGAEMIGYVLDPVVKPDGTFKVITTSQVDLGACDIVMIGWENGPGDMFTLSTSSPSVVVQVGSATVSGTARRGTTLTTTLKSGSTVRGSLTKTLKPDRMTFAGPFRKNNSNVLVEPGDKVFHSQASGALLTVLTPDITVTLADFGTVEATCFPNGLALIQVNGVYAREAAQDETGAVSETNLVGGGLATGDVVTVRCESSKGGGQILEALAPAP